VLLQVLEFLYPALLATVVLSAIHSGLGIRLLERGAVLPALALVQLAALGTAIATRCGFSPYIGAFVLSMLGAALFRVNRHDTLVAMVYVVSAAATRLFLGGDPLTGDLLSVRVRTIALIALVYIGVAVALHFLRRESLLFFAVAIVLTSSVRIAGVLLAFTYLVAPAVISRRFAIAWPVSVLLSAAGILLAFKFDQPTALTVVCTFGVALIGTRLAQQHGSGRKPAPGT